jgi:hypothetical protein
MVPPLNSLGLGARRKLLDEVAFQARHIAKKGVKALGGRDAGDKVMDDGDDPLLPSKGFV